MSDVVVVGGGIMGSALAYWLTRLDPGAAVTVLERDPSYAHASSALSAASIRQQFTTPLNIRISQHSIEFLRHAAEWLADDGTAPDIGLTERGYLYLASPDNAATLSAAHAVQRRVGAEVALLDHAGLARRFPWLSLDGIELGSLGLSGEGWFDGYALLRAFGARARRQGAKFVRGEVVAIDTAQHRVRSVALADGRRLQGDWLVNAAGPWARGVARLAGVELPVEARRRTVFVLDCRQGPADCPLLIDPSGFWLRPDGQRFIGAPPPASDPDGAPLEPELGLFEDVFWPALAARIPAFEATRVERAWAGYYEYNTFDQNGIVGLHPSLDNLAFMNGFSGHGMQQAPIVARGVAELILTGRYVTLDLGALGFARLIDGRPLRELNVIG